MAYFAVCPLVPIPIPPEEHIDLMVYRLPSYPYEGPILHRWLRDHYQPGQLINTVKSRWRGFDPTNNKLVSSEHIPVAVSREQEKASPPSGSWQGPSDAFDQMTVSVQVVDAS